MCDPAMGSGAFLVEACRQLASRLVRAWAWHRGTRPEIPPDEDEDLLARRLVAQRCLYGVDRNPMATDLARLSLWLATLARDHEFTFLDHALKTGDSLVGLTARQIGGLRWADAQSDVAPFDGFLRDRVRQVTEGRREIREAPDDVMREIQEQRYQHVEAWTEQVRLLGNATLAAFFSADRARARETARLNLGVMASLGPEQSWPRIRDGAAGLLAGKNALRPFHWEIEFPEVFGACDGGFDAIVGNPPFAGAITLLHSHREHYLDWLQTLHAGAHGNADLVAHFFRRAFGLLKKGGCAGLIATNTLSQGDTRSTGLEAILKAGGSIARALRRLPWPGEAAVVVSVVHVIRGMKFRAILDGRPVTRVSAYLMPGDLDQAPSRLWANRGYAFLGCKPLGMGFTFDDLAAVKGLASSIAEMRKLIAKDPSNLARIFPFLGGEELNSDARHAYRRWCIDFDDYPLSRQKGCTSWFALSDAEKAHAIADGVVPSDYPGPVAEDWPDLIEIIRRLVKPARDKDKRDARRLRWWQFAERAPSLRRALEGVDEVIVIPRVTQHPNFAVVAANVIFSEKVVVFPNSSRALLGTLSSRCSETWIRFFTSTMKDDLNYSPSDCFENFPLPKRYETDTTLLAAGTAFHDHRAALMIVRNEGLTKTCNRFHDTSDRAPDINRLRDLHHAMDVAVLGAYGWDDLADTAAPEFLTEDTEQDHRYQGRLFWPAPFRDEVLARLLALNAERAADEAARGLAPADATLGAGELEEV